MAAPLTHQNVVVNCYTAQETVELCSRSGVAKANMRLDKMFISSVLAGMLLAFACAASLSTQTAPWYQENAPGLIRMIGAIIFPFGLTMIVVTGADLCTGSFMFTTISVLHGRLSVWKMLRHWAVTFVGNLAGSLFIACLLMGEGGVFDSDPFKTQAINFANKKVVTPMWHQIFLRGIGANWLVCLACFLAFMAREFFSKVAAVWWPTFAFVCLGLDHVVANMFFIPIAIFVGDPSISIGFYIWKSMIPTLIGNIIGGGFFVGAAYWYLYLTGDTKPVPIDGALFGLDGIPIMSSTWEAEEQRRRQSSAGGKSADNMV
ncbi:Formate/nitrite transporter [Dissoconium aciculare CBS 342.82]|uniref:Formate/nitrite transporter n=1 Tax=Dissoconium aciculare CBS 342.82 TaxID=1314786 RepID=A0A6J3LWR3_9PEZI|nr:Formate/nitrite transporter [Dissoconium aciculare CBS 342.82]KAF1820201.1 Formate/nitrite transporter [Dissoconium aciculare CBS 342.82]